MQLILCKDSANRAKWQRKTCFYLHFRVQPILSIRCTFFSNMSPSFTETTFLAYIGYYWSESEISVIACAYGFATDKVLAAVLMVMTPSQSSYAQSSTTAKRCEATTKKGTRCKNTAVNNTKYCQLHQAKSPNVQQCKAMTKSGSRCSIGAKTSGYCKQHYQMPLEGKL